MYGLYVGDERIAVLSDPSRVDMYWWSYRLEAVSDRADAQIHSPTFWEASSYQIRDEQGHEVNSDTLAGDCQAFCSRQTERLSFRSLPPLGDTAEGHSDRPLYSCWTKAIISDADPLRTGPAWVTARRAKLTLFADHLKCGDWTIAYSDIQSAVLASIRSTLLRIPGYVLTVKTAEQTYHFGLNGSKYWRGELPFSVTRQKKTLKLSAFSIVVRVLAIGLAAYYWWWLIKR